MPSMIAAGKVAGVSMAMALLLAACGDKATPGAGEAAVGSDAVTTESMPAEESAGDVMMDGSATDATADAAPPADPMLEVPAEPAPAVGQ